METDTATLRKAAPNWSLAGDKQLLGMLQKIHQKIMTKCEEANKKLDAMVDALDNASIDLQNVNNKFMALSNSQFVESRVYDDDVDVSSTNRNIAQSEPLLVAAESELTKLKHSLQKLEQMHEPVHILDSDSSDEEEDGRTVLKPKEIYSHRPLPYIIGSQAWRTKWHAGLVQEDSDSDSSISKHDTKPVEEYSESEPETVPTDKFAHRTISSSSLESEFTPLSQATSEATRQPTKPADVAAELARRLGGQPEQVRIPVSAPVDIQTPSEKTSNKVYRVEKPAPSTIFCDEPPPLDDYQSYKSDYTDDDDIFAELHKKPYPNSNRDQKRVTKGIFGGLSDNIVDDLFGEVETRDNDIGNVIDITVYRDVTPSTSDREIPPAFDDKHLSNLVEKKSAPEAKIIETKTEIESAVTKKPVGGISLFGTNKGTESIGAAILKRNQRKSSTSEEDTSNVIEGKEKIPSVANTNEEPVNKIIEDLFKRPLKKTTKKEEIIKREEPERVKNTKIDLFNDSLFDDIDDIFTTNVITKPRDCKPQNSIFDDDLFSDVTVKEPENYSNIKSNTKSILSSNDNLLIKNENTLGSKLTTPSKLINVQKDDITEGNVKVESDSKAKETIRTSLFDDDSEDELFSDVKKLSEIRKPHKSLIEDNRQVEATAMVIDDTSPSVNLVNNDINNSLNHKSENKSLLNPVSYKSELESPCLFVDEEFDDLFSASGKLNIDQSCVNDVEENEHIVNNEKLKTIESNKIINKKEKVQSQITENIVSSSHSKSDQIAQSDSEFIESCDIVTKNNLVSTEINNSCILKEDEFDITFQPKETTDPDIPNTRCEESDAKQHTETSYLPNIVDIKSEDLKYSETLYTSVNNIPPLDTIPDTTIPESSDPDLFTDIFADMPPVFEKPLEPKKSKNVNALFDDDSDDEALFFKKNEGVSDEKPDLNFSSDRFRIFHDEPPEIDIDFSQKDLKIPPRINEQPNDELFTNAPNLSELDSKYTQIAHIPVKESIKHVNDTQENIDDYEENTNTNVDITKLIEESKDIEEKQKATINISNILDNAKTHIKDFREEVGEKLIVSETETIENKNLIDEIEPKKNIGKLKPINFNINVNTLLPGASLNKTKTNDEMDGQTISTKSNEELNFDNSERIESKIVKSVSFDGDPEAEILDNKLSKQRAKIQVKRRPSSRKARLEAVRKSRIDLASDSTDNSSSFDEPSYKQIVNKEENKFETVAQEIPKNSFACNENTSTINVISPTNIITAPLTKTLPNIVNLVDTKTIQSDVKSKVVYILNDEDIFNDTHLSKRDNSESAGQDQNVLDIVDDDDDELLFKSPNIPTLGKTYDSKTISALVEPELDATISKESVQKYSKNVKDELMNTKKSLFDDLSDDENELFGNKKTAVQKTNILFDSNSKDKLFVMSKKNVQAKKEIVKGSLFGDESDDDSDLFGVKAENKPAKRQNNIRQNISKTKEVAATTSEAVFEDPLSMFGDDS